MLDSVHGLTSFQTRFPSLIEIQVALISINRRFRWRINLDWAENTESTVQIQDFFRKRSPDSDLHRVNQRCVEALHRFSPRLEKRENFAAWLCSLRSLCLVIFLVLVSVNVVLISSLYARLFLPFPSLSRSNTCQTHFLLRDQNIQFAVDTICERK